MKELKQTLKSLFMTLPVLFGVLLLISLFQSSFTNDQLMRLFSGNLFFDSVIGASIGAVLAGNPITSYVLGGEFFDAGISIMAVSAFIVTWVTVGIVQLPAEILLLGKKFALLRNLFSFLSAIVIGICTYLILLVW
jgi:uncharacterized membrane protein YraQ (UPF0718 family)